MGRRFSGLILDWAGVLTTNMVEVFESFEAREGLSRGLFLSKWADPRGQDLYRRKSEPSVAGDVAGAARFADLRGAGVHC